jgi:hypothetical protein
MVVAGLACSAAAQVNEQPGDLVEVKSLLASGQETINQKAAGGEVVQVKRGDDSNGKWNYEVVLRTNRKESAFEIDPKRQAPETAHRSQKIRAAVAAFFQSLYRRMWPIGAYWKYGVSAESLFRLATNSFSFFLPTKITIP